MMFSIIYQYMRSGFESSFFKFIFKYTSLGSLLVERETNPSVFFHVYFSSWWWTRAWFRSCFVNPNQLKRFDSIVKQLVMLKERGLENETIINAIANTAHPSTLESALNLLANAEILNQDNLVVCADSASPTYLADALARLHEEGILTQDTRLLMSSSRRQDEPNAIIHTYLLLQEQGILSAHRLEMIRSHQAPFSMFKAIFLLQQEEILTDLNLDFLVAAEDPEMLAKGMQYLHRAEILTEENNAFIATRTNPHFLAESMVALHHAGILNAENLGLIVNRGLSTYSAQLLLILNHENLLIPENRVVLANMQVHFPLYDTCLRLQRAGILTQANFVTLTQNNHASLLTMNANDVLWTRLPDHLLTQANFDMIIRASENIDPLLALQQLRNQILMRPQVTPQLNPQQSTHTASVHRSVSESAVCLMKTYSNSLELESTIQDIQTFVDHLDDTPIHQAVKRCISRITSVRYCFADSVSDVSTRQLLALGWLAVHDRNRCTASLEDALSLFVKGLYEIQRGYNIEAGQGPDEGDDRAICEAGTFNKLMEKLGGGIHPDVEIIYITHDFASLKFAKLIQLQTIAYLKTQVRPETAADYLAVKKLINTLEQDESVASIWPIIKETVCKEIWAEFQEAYGRNPEHHRFQEMAKDYYLDVDVPNLSALKQELMASTGYQSLQYQQHHLWANRHTSSEAQQEFDREYGLSIVPYAIVQFNPT